MVFDSKEILSVRTKAILEAIIQEYILTAEPVGSRKISKKYSLDLSPATVRNIMADLEEVGFLSQPHTSAGRIPTDKGLRFYVDTLLKNRQLSLQEQEAIRERYQHSSAEVSALMKETSKILSELSHGTAVVMAPKFMDTIFRRIEFILLSKTQILAIFVSQSGLLQNKLIEFEEEDLVQEDLDKFSRYLNDILSGLTLREVRKKILEEMKNEKNMYDKLYSRALEWGERALGNDLEAEVYVDGQINLLDYPEFTEKKEKMKSLFKAFQEKSTLLKILDLALETEGLRIIIGAENEMEEMEGCSMVLSPYSQGSNVLGSLGVVGPTRMNYFYIVPIVDYISKLVSDYLEPK